MEVYETDDELTSVQVDKFTTWFDDNIGTDYEVNHSANGIKDNFYILFLDLTRKEVTQVAKFEMECCKWKYLKE